MGCALSSPFADMYALTFGILLGYFVSIVSGLGVEPEAHWNLSEIWDSNNRRFF